MKLSNFVFAYEIAEMLSSVAEEIARFFMLNLVHHQIQACCYPDKDPETEGSTKLNRRFRVANQFQDDDFIHSVTVCPSVFDRQTCNPVFSQ